MRRTEDLLKDWCRDVVEPMMYVSVRRWRRRERIDWEKILNRYVNAFRRSREPLFVLMRKHRLSKDEKAIFLTALVYGYIRGENRIRIAEILNTLWEDGEQIGKIRYLDENSKLVRSGMIKLAESLHAPLRFRRSRELYPMVEVPKDLMYEIIGAKFPVSEEVERMAEEENIPACLLYTSPSPRD